MFLTRNRVVKSVALAWLLFAAPAAAADKEPPAIGRVLFSRRGQLGEIDVARKGPPTPRGQVEAGAEVLTMEATRDGTVVVVTTAAKSTWLKDGAQVPDQTCAGRARPSPRGECIACLEAAAVRLVATAGKLISALPAELKEVNFYGGTTAELVALAPDGVVAFPPMKPGQRRLVAKAGPRSHLLLSPDGSRGVAVFGPKEESRIFSFALDGVGVPRQLGGPGVPLVWSWDSQWVLLQEGLPPEDEGGGEGALLLGPSDRFLLAAPKKKGKKKKKSSLALTRACAVRAMGGEAKCWNHYEGVAMSPDSRFALLRKDGNLYVGRIAGVKAEKPKLLVEAADPGATWIP